MATTTAAVTLTSDLLSDNMSVSASTTCMKAGTTADGLDMMEYGYVDITSGAAGTRSESDIIIVPSVATTMDLEHMLLKQ